MKHPRALLLKCGLPAIEGFATPTERGSLHYAVSSHFHRWRLGKVMPVGWVKASPVTRDIISWECNWRKFVLQTGKCARQSIYPKPGCPALHYNLAQALRCQACSAGPSVEFRRVHQLDSGPPIP